jgi:uroporphyrinogen decarboxylase
MRLGVAIRAVLSLQAVAAFAPTPFTMTAVSRGQILIQSSSALIVSAAQSPAEDLELTRQVILGRLHNSPTPDGANGDPVVATIPSPSVTVDRTVDDDDTNKRTDRPQNDLLLRAAVGEKVEQTPLWLFRQAGRHLPEYQDYKAQTNKNFLELLASPACVAECTMQPIRRYDLDAAILFSDILVVPEALGIQVTMPGGVGILVPEPLTSPEEVHTRLPSIDQITPDFVQTKLAHVIEAVRTIRTQMAEENKSIPLIGFSAAPWTLMYYMVGGSSKKNTELGVTWLEDYPEASGDLLALLTKIVVEYMDAQVLAGAHVLQVFEAMGMMIDDVNFEKHALPCLRTIAQELKTRHPDIPLMVFCRGACHLNNQLVGLGYDVITMDGSVDRTTVRQQLGNTVTLQGNYDPAELIEENGKTVETVRATAKKLLQELGPQRLIANLGEGLGGKESPELVDAFVKAIHEESAAMILQDSKVEN